MSVFTDFNKRAAVVIHIDSSKIQAGFSKEKIPCYCDIPVVGRTEDNKTIIGSRALTYQQKLDLTFPIKNGYIQSIESMEQLWSHLFYSVLKVEPSEHPVLMTEPPLNPTALRERTIKTMFETFDIRLFYLATHPLLSLYENQIMTGTVVDVGEEVTFVVPIYEGYALPHAISIIPIGGLDVNKRLKSAYISKGYKFETTIEEEIISDLRTTCCFILSKKENLKEAELPDLSYRLPNDRYISLGSELYESTEVFFEDTTEQKSIPRICHESLLECDFDIRYALYGNIILAGGNCSIKGFSQRFENEMKKHSTLSKIVNQSGDHKNFSSWLGGSLLASLEMFQTMYISKQEYEEFGPSMVTRKCF